MAATSLRSDVAPATLPGRFPVPPKQGHAKPAKVIRDSFTMPHADYEMIGALKQRCLGLGVAMKKSELLRAGLAVLRQLPDERLLEVVAAVESVKTGRPPGKKKKKHKKKKKKKHRA
ncbi:MAG TPA: hypothetical protein VMM27_07380 [Casimicrobiaceae bacterium]|nr:hypothetical protein [Casimicrobiaceae bacterium]